MRILFPGEASYFSSLQATIAKLYLISNIADIPGKVLRICTPRHMQEWATNHQQIIKYVYSFNTSCFPKFFTNVFITQKYIRIRNGDTLINSTSQSQDRTTRKQAKQESIKIFQTTVTIFLTMLPTSLKKAINFD